MNFTDFDNVAAYCVPHRQTAFPKKVGADYKQLVYLQPDGVYLEKCVSVGNCMGHRTKWLEYSYRHLLPAPETRPDGKRSDSRLGLWKHLST